MIYGRSSKLLSDRLATYLLAFMRTGNPNTDGYTDWPRFEQQDPQLMQINLPMSAGPVERSAHYELIEESGIW